MTLDFAALEDAALVPKRVMVGQWIADYDRKGRETGRKLTGQFMADHPFVGRLMLNISILGGAKTSLQVSVSLPGRKTRVPVYRIDMGAARFHSNLPRAGDPDGGRLFGPDDNHVHDFTDRLNDDRADHFARPCPQTIVDFRSAIEHLCARFNVENPGDIPDPISQGILL